ncbi:MAG: DUF4295 family protein [Flavobacteriaceae bacterium]|nr:DUF4295 family protein [Flavobacteriaceae bacterium]
MAKKAVATLQTGSNKLTKVIKMSKKKHGSYSFVESMVSSNQVDKWLKSH